MKGGLTGAVFGASTGATFGANLVSSGAASGVLYAVGGNAFGQFFGSKGLINLTEVGVSGALGAIPGGIQSALINDAVISGIGQNAINTAAGLGLVGQWKLAGEALGQGISPALPSYNVNLSSTYNQVQQFTNSVTTSISSFLNNASANGGFVIYPNKSNSNMMQSAYKKIIHIINNKMKIYSRSFLFLIHMVGLIFGRICFSLSIIMWIIAILNGTRTTVPDAVTPDPILTELAIIFGILWVLGITLYIISSLFLPCDKCGRLQQFSL